jgi:hypothetical protein
VTGYRLYFFDGKRRPSHKVARSVCVAASGEQDAIQESERLRNGRYAELWHMDHLVRIFDPERR